MAIMLYALYTYHWRAASIRRGGRGPYDDRFGPVSIMYVRHSYNFHLPTDYPLHRTAEYGSNYFRP